ncbi:PH domain-containing protein [Streptomyces sp. NBC_00691]|uniref:PH domain-containing protein n=1 Tax=Streptomyces sp. NBC_00691 TaxID=2903671 RepID=UPI002E33C998|nr:PH domain-containing protein [Streptomyces sp. NBC_00691]
MDTQRVLPREYRIRSGRLAAVYLAAGVGLPTAGLPIWTEEDIPGWVRTLGTLLLLALLGWLVLAARSSSTSADLKGIRVRGMVRSRRLAWEDIHDLRAVPNPSAAMGQGQPRIISYMYGRDGRRVQLMYLDDNHVAVDREIAALRVAWERHRGDGWSPNAAADRRIDSRSRREGSLLRALSWALMSVLAAVVLFLVLLFTDSDAMSPEWILIIPVVVFLVVWIGSSLRGRNQ